jgi:hypothetical protein
MNTVNIFSSYEEYTAGAVIGDAVKEYNQPFNGVRLLEFILGFGVP